MGVSTRNKEPELRTIPRDWKIVEFGEVTEKIVGGGTPSRSNPNYWGGEIPWATVKDFATFNDCKTQEYITKDGLKNSSSHLIPKGVIITSTRMGLGKAVIYNIDVSINQDLKAIYVKKDIDTIFLYYWFSFNSKYIEELGSGSTVMGLSLPDMRKIAVKLPPTKAEQTAIATALSHADALVNSLEKLIAKKRSIKQGAMQKLLKPKKGWETKTLKELARYRRGSFPQPYGLDKWYDDTNGLPFVQVFDVDDNFRLKSDTKRRISKEAQAMSVYIEKGSVVITLQGSIGRIAITQYDAYVDRTLLFFESFIVPFDKYFFLLSIFSLFEKEKEKAPGGIIKTITKEALSSFTISYPKIEEQNYIASILSDIDADIKTLEVKLEKCRKVKLGMMQNLLTGKIRLV